MSKMGGYQILDLGGVELSGSAVTINGAYETIKNSNGKAILVSGANFSGTKVADTFACAIPGENKYSFLICGHQIEVTSTDEVTVVPTNTDLLGIPKMTKVSTASDIQPYGLVRIWEGDAIDGSKAFKIFSKGTSAANGSLVFNCLNFVNTIPADADAATLVLILNALFNDMKNKGIMLKSAQ